MSKFLTALPLCAAMAVMAPMGVWAQTTTETPTTEQTQSGTASQI